MVIKQQKVVVTVVVAVKQAYTYIHIYIKLQPHPVGAGLHIFSRINGVPFVTVETLHPLLLLVSGQYLPQCERKK